jgi:hypothetical protein
MKETIKKMEDLLGHLQEKSKREPTPMTAGQRNGRSPRKAKSIRRRRTDCRKWQMKSRNGSMN